MSEEGGLREEEVVFERSETRDELLVSEEDGEERSVGVDVGFFDRGVEPGSTLGIISNRGG